MLKITPIADAPARVMEGALERAPYLRRLSEKGLEMDWQAGAGRCSRPAT